MSNFEMVKLSSVPLQSIIGNECIPKRLASGCIIKYPKNDYLLTVFHAVSKNIGTWAVLSEWIAGKGTKYVKLGGFTTQKLFLVDMNTKKDLDFKRLPSEDIDFAFTKFPKEIENYYQEIGNDYKIRNNAKRSKFDNSMLKEPDKESKYGFSGQIMPIVFEGVALETKNMVYENLKYDKTLGNFHYFDLPFNHPGHDYFQGCSGAPIIDESGNIVSLVCGPDDDVDGKIPNKILGINLSKFKIAIEIEEGLLE